jgi:hypothetical protein
MNLKMKFYAKIISVLILALPIISLASVESTLGNVQNRLINTILPAVSIIGLAWAALSFVMGHENAKGRVFLAVIGVIIGFSAPSIVDFLRGIAH